MILFVDCGGTDTYIPPQIRDESDPNLRYKTKLIQSKDEHFRQQANEQVYKRLELYQQHTPQRNYGYVKTRMIPQPPASRAYQLPRKPITKKSTIVTSPYL